ncbi:MAG: SIMPL domain-containing protein [Bacteroidota bacterium]
MKSFINTAAICVSIIIGLVILGESYKYKFKANETISVTGMSEKDFTSDLIVWGGSFTRDAFTLKEAYASLKQDENTIRNYLQSKGISNTEIIFTSVTMNKNFQRKYDDKGNEISSDFSGYTLSENVRVESREIDKVEKLSREITELLEKDIELNSNAPEYFYTKLNELKIDLLAKASADAKNRAETIANNGGSSIKGINKATMGVFQITGKNENEDYSYGGAFNTSSKLKTASITLKVDYRLK